VHPISEMQESLPLDGHGLDDDQDFFREVRLAWTLANRPGAASPDVSLRDIWQMATIGGAAITLGPNTPLGKLEAGYLADLVLVDRGTGLDDWLRGGDYTACHSPASAHRLPLALTSNSARKGHLCDYPPR